MFSGIVAAMGRIEAVPAPGRSSLGISKPSGWAELAIGESLAVNGCCLTVVAAQGELVKVDVMPETLRRTALNRLGVGDPVNLEKALELRGLVGGHLVTGHVDGTGVVAGVRAEGNAVWVQVHVPERVARYCIPQGSIAIDGCSLTLVNVTDREDGSGTIEVSLIPHTRSATVASEYRPGTVVNLEADSVAKLVERLVRPHLLPAQRSFPAAGSQVTAR